MWPGTAPEQYPVDWKQEVELVVKWGSSHSHLLQVAYHLGDRQLLCFYLLPVLWGKRWQCRKSSAMLSPQQEGLPVFLSFVAGSSLEEQKKLLHQPLSLPQPQRVCHSEKRAKESSAELLLKLVLVPRENRQANWHSALGKYFVLITVVAKASFISIAQKAAVAWALERMMASTQASLPVLFSIGHTIRVFKKKN